MGNHDDILNILQQFDDSEREIENFFNLMLFRIARADTEDITPNSFQKPGILKSYLNKWLSQTCHFLHDRRAVQTLKHYVMISDSY